MLCSFAITATVITLPGQFHDVHWVPRAELTLDCFICRRTGRTTVFEQGAEQAVCTGDSAIGPHPTAARIAAFDPTNDTERTSVELVIDRWWAPVHDAADQRPGADVARSPWVRLHLGYYCPDQDRAAEFSIQSNHVRPMTQACEHCSAPIARSDETPWVRPMS